MAEENTKFDEIYEIFLLSIQDYRIKKLFNETPVVGNNLVQHILIKALGHFKNCVKAISNINPKTDLDFGCVLNNDEKGIINDLMIEEWLKWNIDDITQMNITLNDNDFKHFSEAQNLTSKVEYYNKLREQSSQRMVDYSLCNIPFAEWAGGNYGL